MTHAKPQSRKGEEILPFFAPLRLCVRKILFPSLGIWRFVTRKKTGARLCVCIIALSMIHGLTGCCPILRTNIPKTNGHVFDARTHRPIAGAIVAFQRDQNVHGCIIESDEVSVKTGTDGSFSFARQRKLDVWMPTDCLFRLVKPFVIRHQGYRDYKSWVPLPYWGPWPASSSKPKENLKIFLQPDKR
ncbi:MAG: hypothetical protein ACFUZC_13545 [Chthoniobacteraceae bacterium]